MQVPAAECSINIFYARKKERSALMIHLDPSIHLIWETSSGLTLGLENREGIGRGRLTKQMKCDKMMNEEETRFPTKEEIYETTVQIYSLMFLVSLNWIFIWKSKVYWKKVQLKNSTLIS